MGWHGVGKMVGQRGQLGSGITHTHTYIYSSSTATDL